MHEVSLDSILRGVSSCHNLFDANTLRKRGDAYHTTLPDTLQVTNILSISNIPKRVIHLSNPSNWLHTVLVQLGNPDP